jgi:hypothetical protein
MFYCREQVTLGCPSAADALAFGETFPLPSGESLATTAEPLGVNIRADKEAALVEAALIKAMLHIP